MQASNLVVSNLVAIFLSQFLWKLTLNNNNTQVFLKTLTQVPEIRCPFLLVATIGLKET